MFSENGGLLNERKNDILKKLAGRFMIVTDTELPDSETVFPYKEQWKIEGSSRTIKSFIEVRRYTTENPFGSKRMFSYAYCPSAFRDH